MLYFYNFLESNEQKRRFKPARVNAIEFIHTYYLAGNPLKHSIRTVMRAYKRMRWSRKKISRKNVKANPTEQWAFLQRASFLRPEDLIDIDETPGGREKFLQRYGYSPIGEACVKNQIIIGQKSYSIIAAYCTSGFLCWEIVEGGIDQVIFGNFIIDAVRVFFFRWGSSSSPRLFASLLLFTLASMIEGARGCRWVMICTCTV